ncbi:unnamed protein product, partial [marine sediment metagenome]
LESAGVGDTITFDPLVFPPDDPAVIYPQSKLPAICQPRTRITIDGSNAGVVIDGRDVPGRWSNGLQIYTNSCVVMGLQVVNFTGAGIQACDARYVTIGGDPNIGSGPNGQGNLISGNRVGVLLCDSCESNVITGNFIGVALDGSPWGNTRPGILIQGGVRGTQIGPGNIIANNGVGIEITGSEAFGNTIVENQFGSNLCGSISLSEAANNGIKPPSISASSQDLLEGLACPGCEVHVYSTTTLEGERYLGSTIASLDGAFRYVAESAPVEQALIAYCTDPQGNSSAFSFPQKCIEIQGGHECAFTGISAKQSPDLEDNRIGGHIHGLWEVPDPLEAYADHIVELGLKQFRLSLNSMDVATIRWDKPELIVDPNHDAFIDKLVENGIEVTCVLIFWDKDTHNQGGTVPSPRFTTDDEVERWLDYVARIVSHFRGRVERFEIWNEPNNPGIQRIEPEDYISLIKRTVPTIRNA